MIPLLIIGGIVLIIIILLNCPVTAELSYISEKFNVTVKYLFFTLYPIKEKPKKIKKKNHKNKKKPKKSNRPQKTSSVKAEKAESLTIQNLTEKTISKSETQNSAENKNIDKKSSPAQEQKNTDDIKSDSKKKKFDTEGIKENIKLVKNILVSSKKGLRRLLRNIKIYDIFVDIDVADSDAAKAAISYGKMNAIVYNAISFIRVFFTISLKKIIINCKYNSDESKYDFAGIIIIRPATVLLALISILFNYFVNTLKEQKNKETERNVENNERTSN